MHIKHHTKLKFFTTACLILILISVCTLSSRVPAPEMDTLDLTLTNNDFFIDETDYESAMNDIVIPYLESLLKDGYFTTPDSLNIYYQKYQLEDAKGAIVISHGFSESSAKYEEVIYYFLNEGYSVYILDYRGHGYSDRLVEDLSLVHVDDFEDYVTDLKLFLDDIIIPENDDMPLLLYAHSMGGAVGTLFLEQYPDYFDAAVLSCPMMEVELGNFPKPFAIAVSNLYSAVNLGENYIFTHGPFEGVSDFEDSSATSLARYTYFFNKQINDSFLQTSGASFNWLKEALHATKVLTDKENTTNIKVPVLIFEADNDSFVKALGHYKFVNNTPSSELIYVPNSKHNLYFTSNDIMIPYFNTIFNFLEPFTNIN